MIKDTLFFAVHALFFCSFIDVWNLCTKDKGDKKIWISFGITSILVCIMRNDGIYRVLPSAFLLLIVAKKYHKVLASGICLLLVFTMGYNVCVFDVLNVTKGSAKEMASIPFQQTARYVRDCGDITEEERIIIDNLLVFETLGERYNEELSDPVKNRMRSMTQKEMEEKLSHYMKEYMMVWFAMGIRHPGIYIQATINNTYGYFYPFRNSRVMGAYQNYIKGEPVNKGFDINYELPDAWREKVSNWSEVWRIFPGVSLLSNPGTYTWIVMGAILLL